MEKGLSQSQLANRMGCHRTYFSKIESGQVRPMVEQFVRIADAIGIMPSELLDYTYKLQLAMEA